MPGNNDLRFHVFCNAGEHGCLCVGSDTLVVNIGQRILRDGRAEMWDSVVVKCCKAEDGSVAVRVLLCNPDWEEPLQIACVRSRLDADLSNQAALVCDLGCGAEP